jgi:hypothetical protein
METKNRRGDLISTKAEICKRREMDTDIGSKMPSRKNSNLTDPERHVPGEKVKNSVGMRSQRNILSSMKGGLKSLLSKARSRQQTMRQGKPRISLPWVDPQEKINILQGRGPLIQLGDIGALPIDVPLDPAIARERRALDRHFKPQARRSASPQRNSSMAGLRHDGRNFGQSPPGRPSSDAAHLEEGEYGLSSISLLLEEYFHDGDGDGRAGPSAKRTGRQLCSTDGSSSDRRHVTNSRGMSHEGAHCPAQRAGHDRRRDSAPLSNSSQGSDRRRHMTRFEELIAFGKRFGSEKWGEAGERRRLEAGVAPPTAAPNTRLSGKRTEKSKPVLRGH